MGEVVVSEVRVKVDIIFCAEITCGPMTLAALLNEGSIEKGSEVCMDRGNTEVGSYDSSCKKGRKGDRRLETPPEGGLLSGGGGVGILRGVVYGFRV